MARARLGAGDCPTTGGRRHYKHQVVLWGVRNPTNVCGLHPANIRLPVLEFRNDCICTRHTIRTEPDVKRGTGSNAAVSELFAISTTRQNANEIHFDISLYKYTKCDSNESRRRPLVVLEATLRAPCPLTTIAFHKRVKSWWDPNTGKEIFQQLVQGVDAVVYIPLAGPHKSHTFRRPSRFCPL